MDGAIPAGNKKQLTITFSPDHDSDFFSDLVRITISNQVSFSPLEKFYCIFISLQPVKLEFRVRGSGRQNTVYIRPVDNANVVQKSLLPNISDSITAQMQATGWERFEKYSDPTELIIVDPTEKGVASNILVLLCSQFVNGKYAPAQRELIVGCASTSSGPKKVLESF